MKILLVISAILMTLSLAAARAADPDTRCFEMRTYFAAPGKLDDLHARFRDHTMKLFEKHGMENIGYWTPLDNPDRKLIYILAFPRREAREKSWKEFGVDPDWQAAQKASEVNGRLVLKVESVFLAATDYSPAITPMKANGGRVFELRTYHASPGKLDNLHARFRDHTMALFTKHGIMNFGYWTPTEKKDGAGETLVYIVAHQDKDAAAASWKAFREDADWVKAKAASETDGSLTVKDGVQSVYMLPTDYSPTR
jgi:hypothetical protein